MPGRATGDLCQSCGLCCDGSLFGRGDLQPGEVEGARRNRLRVLPGAKGFEQPCSALANAGAGLRSCSVYDERPLACRRFVCRLHERYREEGGLLEERIAVVRRVRWLVARLEASGRTPADLETAAHSDGPTTAEAEEDLRHYRELTRILEEDFARAP